jgi:hypothetical protein
MRPFSIQAAFVYRMRYLGGNALFFAAITPAGADPKARAPSPPGRKLNIAILRIGAKLML